MGTEFPHDQAKDFGSLEFTSVKATEEGAGRFTLYLWKIKEALNENPYSLRLVEMYVAPFPTPRRTPTLQAEHSLYEETQNAPSGANVEIASEQSDAGAKRNWGGPHAINIRLTIPMLVGSFYLTIVAGRERRSAERQRAERHLHPLLKIGNVVMFLVFGTVVGLALLSVFQLFFYRVFL